MSNRKKRKPLSHKDFEYMGLVKNAYDKWFEFLDFEIDITLTPEHVLPKNVAEALFSKYWCLVGKALFGNAVRRYSKSLQRMVSMEKGEKCDEVGYENLNFWHQHGSVKIPNGMTYDKLREVLIQTWFKCECAGTILVRPMWFKGGWEQYSKKQYVNSNFEAFSARSSHLNFGKNTELYDKALNQFVK